MSSKNFFLIIKDYFFSIQAKLIFFTSLLVIIVMSLVGYQSIGREREMLLRHIKEEGQVLAESMAIPFITALLYEEVGLVEEAGLLDHYIERLMKKSHPDIRYALVLSAEGKVIAHNDLKEYGQIYRDELTRRAMDSWQTLIQPYHDHDKRIKGLDIATPLNIASKRWGTLRIGLSLSRVEQQIAALRKKIILMGFVLTCLAVGGIVLLARSLTGPLRDLSHKMDTLNLQDLKLDLVPKGHDEVAVLQRSCLWMLDRLKKEEEERTNTERHLARTERMASLGRLSAGVAHEINNPLGGILNCLNLLAQDNLPQEKKEEYLSLMQDGLKRIQKAIRNMLEYSQEQTQDLIPTDINTVIDQTLLLVGYLLEEKGIKLEKNYSCSCEISSVLLDRHQISHVFLNLIVNAIQAMDSEGDILKIETSSDNSYCRIEISDNGQGIAEEDMDRIFEPFFTTKDVGEGTGLGLPVSLGIIKRHGGNISVKSKLGRGSTFTVTLPLHLKPEKISMTHSPHMEANVTDR
jgi:signal transduction histidine kinase